MLNIDIPGHIRLDLKYLVADYNGTLACDGKLLPKLAPLITELSNQLEIHVVTADTFGIAAQETAALPVKLTVLPADNQDRRKAEYVRKLGPDCCVGLGNGRNDALMLKEASLGICVVEAEGANTAALAAADVICRSARDAICLLLNPKRLVATLRR